MIYPVTIQIDTPDRVANWRPLVNWILSIPHLLILSFLIHVAMVLSFVSWAVIVITGRLPRDIASFQIMVLRYQTRIGAYVSCLHEQYPPFEFELTFTEPGGGPVTLGCTPSLDGRNRLTVLFRWLWAIPALLYSYLVSFVGGVCMLLGWLAVLFTGRWPDSLRCMVVESFSFATRLNAYVLLLIDDYPPLDVHARLRASADRQTSHR